MSKAKFAVAKELIDEKQYDAARAILKTIDHPTAREWEAKLAIIAPPIINSAHPVGNRYIYNVVRVIAIVFIVVIVVALILSQIQKTALDILPAYQAAGNQLATINHPATNTPVGTSTALSVAINAATSTVVASATSTSSPTVTPTSTLSPTATTTSTSTTAPLTATPVKLTFSGTNPKVIGPIEIPEGIYRAIFTTTGYGSVTLSTTKGECGADMSGLILPNLFLTVTGQANVGAEAVLKSTGCTTLIQVGNVNEAWSLAIELIN